MDYAKVFLIRNVTHEPEVKEKHATFKMAVGRKNKRSFFTIVVFGPQAQAVAKNLAKGKRVFVEGALEASNGYLRVLADPWRRL